jgi:hypothetical protein
MVIELLLEERLGLNDKITIIQDFGLIEIVIDDDICNTVLGKHVILQGDEADFKDWLRPFDCVYVSTGIPMMQSFEACNIK